MFNNFQRHNTSCKPLFTTKNKENNENSEKHHGKNELNQLWKLRIHKIYHLLSEGYSVFLADVDSLWNYHVDLEKLPSNFDVIHSVADNHPELIKQLWGFTVCGGSAFYRPTEAVLTMWKLFLNYCAVPYDPIAVQPRRYNRRPVEPAHCDDQKLINESYHVKGVEWFDVGDTRQELCFESKLGYHKIGVFTNPEGIGSMRNKIEAKRKFGMDTVHNVKLQIMVVSKDDILRGGSMNECDSVWIMHPHSKKVGQRKLEMFENYKECVPRVR